MRFGVSTQLYHGQRLVRSHLDELAAAGVDTVELVATRTHMDYHDAAARAELAGWLREAGLRLHSIHAPVTESVAGRQWGSAFTNASAHDADRQRAVDETLLALEIATLVPVQVLVLHVGLPDSMATGHRANDRDAACRSIEAIAAAAATHGVRVALENIPAALSTPESIASIIEDLGLPNVGACLDAGHAHLMAGVPDAIEVFGDMLVATHIHDNHGTRDDHLPPYEGSIAWPTACGALQKVGYGGVLMLEVAPAGGGTAGTLDRIGRARARLLSELSADWSGQVTASADAELAG